MEDKMETKVPGPELRRLKARGQVLQPVVFVGKEGLSDGLVAAVDQALTDHELIKVKFEALKDQKKVLVPELAGRTRSQVIQRVGNVAVLYRARAEKGEKVAKAEESAGEGIAEGAGLD
jgi:RNA-binding protein